MWQRLKWIHTTSRMLNIPCCAVSLVIMLLVCCMKYPQFEISICLGAVKVYTKPSYNKTMHKDLYVHLLLRWRTRYENNVVHRSSLCVVCCVVCGVYATDTSKSNICNVFWMLSSSNWMGWHVFYLNFFPAFFYIWMSINMKMVYNVHHIICQFCRKQA